MTNKKSYQDYLKSEQWSRLRKQAYERAKNLCELCGLAGEAVHHIQYPKNLKDDNLSNLLVVCKNCHDKLHGIKDEFKFIKNKLKINKKEIESANILGVEVGTTGYCGGDAGHGGKTYLAINNLASTAMEARVNKDESGDVAGIELVMLGDTELDTFIEALDFAITKLQENTKDFPRGFISYTYNENKDYYSCDECEYVWQLQNYDSLENNGIKYCPGCGKYIGFLTKIYD